MRRLLLVAALAALLVAPLARAWTWPSDGAVLQGFSFDPAHPYAAGQHRGIDVAGSVGATVVAPAGGTVTFAGSVPNSGKTVSIGTGDGYTVTLTHLGSTSVSKGASVNEGAAVGTIGSSGYVQLGVRTTSNDQGYLDPMSFLPARVAAPPSLVPAPAPDPAPAEPAAPADPAPVADAPAPAAPAPDAPAPDASAPDAPAPVPAAAPAAEAPVADPPIADAPVAVAPPVVDPATVAEAPAVELPPAEAPLVEPPAASAPVADAPSAAAPESAPVADAPAPAPAAAPAAEAPAVDPPPAETPPVESPAAPAPVADVPSPAAPEPAPTPAPAPAATTPVPAGPEAAPVPVAVPYDPLEPAAALVPVASAPVAGTAPAPPIAGPAPAPALPEVPSGIARLVVVSPAPVLHGLGRVLPPHRGRAHQPHARPVASRRQAPARPRPLAQPLPRRPHDLPLTRLPARATRAHRHAQYLKAEHRSLLPFALLAGAVPLLLAAGALRKRVPTMDAHALLRDHADLLRQRPPAHRSRLHDDRGGHPRAPSPAAWRRDVLPHRRGRARDQGLARR